MEAKNEEGAPEAKVEHINIKVAGADGNDLSFKIKKTTPLEKLFAAYATKNGGNVSGFKFTYDGQRIDGHQTPVSLDMEDGDAIDVTVQQLGGF